jgi:DNA polymerase III alpha subunit
MIQLRLRTEFSYRRAFGTLPNVLSALSRPSAASITDSGTWGHVSWAKACKKEGIKPIFGAEVAVVPSADDRTRQGAVVMALLARTDAGLRELYELMSLANSRERFYYVPRLGYGDINRITDNVILLSGSNPDLARLHNRPNVYLELNPTDPSWNRKAAAARGWNRVVCGDNVMPRASDTVAYEVLTGRERRGRTTLMHIPDEYELRDAIPEATDDDFLNTERIAAECDAHLPTATMVQFNRTATLYDLCRAGARSRGLDLDAKRDYYERMTYELDMIASKKFEDYFYVIADLIRYAKEHMLVGPARGSSAGSLVCFLLGITDVDPILHGLMFERFIDVTRSDFPDIDIDFQDDRREMVYTYLAETYGVERVGRLGTVLRYKPASCLGDVARELSIPAWEMADVKDAIIKRSSGDARAQFCVLDALESLEVGRALAEKYPQVRVAADLEGHAQHSGKHAAGVIVTQEPIVHYATIGNDGTLQIDKKDAETLNMLKIDALGLRTLSVIQDALDQIGKTRSWLVTYPLDDVEAFEVFNTERYSGIFQFEGYALQSLTRQMKVRSFDDIAIIGALARPGPLHCGAAGDFVDRRTGTAPVTYLHPLAEPLTKDALGVVIYQEHVMSIAREIGQLSWEDVNQLRRAMSKSLGDEFFAGYWERFKEGAATLGLDERTSRGVWEKMCTFGSWAFNKSHAVSYGLVSYWCAVLKAHYPLEFAAACLRNAKDQDQSVRILRELREEGFTYRAVDPDKSGVTWSVVDGALLGGLTNIKGVGVKMAAAILRRRREGMPLLPGQAKLLRDPTTPFDDVFETRTKFADYFANPKAHNIESGNLTELREIVEPGEYVFIAKLKEKKLRDVNEYQSVVKRGGRKIRRDTLFLNLVLEDDTGTIIARISRYTYNRLGKPIIEAGKIGDYYLWKGRLNDDGWRILQIDKWRKL